MRKFWAWLFAIVPLCAAGSVVYAIWTAKDRQWWLLEGVSTFSTDIDRMFNVILLITGLAFIGTQAILVYALFRFSDTGGRSTYIHTHHQLEMIWTAIPAGILVFIALYQFGAWKTAKFENRIPQEAKSQPLCEVWGTQFDWRFRYPGADGKPGKAKVDDNHDGQVDNWEELLYPGSDDFETVNDFHAPANKPILVHLRSRDVLHSFFLPQFRVKQDAVPGMTIPVWFQALKEGSFELVCAELCGWGHYRMRGQVTIESDGSFSDWLKAEHSKQEVSQ